MSQDLSARRQELMFMLGDDVGKALREAESDLANAQKSLLAREKTYELMSEAQRAAYESEDGINFEGWIRSAQEKVDKFQAIVNMTPDERAALEQELRDIVVQN